jgi:P-type conjugative transfer protein TrbL
MIKKYCLIVLLLLANIAYADCTVAPGGVLDNFVLNFCDSLIKWGSESTSLANKIFMTLFALEFLWQLTIKKVFSGDIEKLWVFFFTRFALGLFFAKYLVNVEVYQGIITFFAEYGARVGGLKVDLHGSTASLFAGVTPSSMISYFSCAADAVHVATDESGTLSYITIKIVLAITQVLFFIAIIITSYLLMEVFIKTYFLLYVGFILTGFAGSSWTVNYWQRYLQQIFAMALEFLTMCVLLGVLSDQFHNWTKVLTDSGSDLVKLSGAFFNMLGVSIIAVLLMEHLPKWVSSKLAGIVHLKLDDKLTAVSGFMSGS